ncbi:unnamed protein product [Brachionus calyciflorus]|uniref:von Willebrand factor A domain-containing protein 8 n=1 Tax=Brachionus calyciflorus TaxID=104777 RepID=A0A813QF16_9BILA|nr:unnamed protein product [Brachionus calyciflorus]
MSRKLVFGFGKYKPFDIGIFIGINVLVGFYVWMPTLSAMFSLKVPKIQILTQISQKCPLTNFSRIYSSQKIDDKNFLRLGDHVKELKNPKNPEKVPRGYLALKNGCNSQSNLQNLQWLLQKDLLKQDCYLIGSPPGSFRRQLALSYAELTKREVEYLCLSKDTTESDIKQRREVKNSSVFYENQCAVNAALNGRILIIEGIEKAERNLLPILNNLLENREINLDDGHFLVAPERYDKLKSLNSDLKNLLRVHEDFRVIAIGLPVPKYKGNPLDPPLRSRFQAHLVSHPNYQDFLQYLKIEFKNTNSEIIEKLCNFSYSFYTSEVSQMGLIDFPIENLERVFKIIDSVKGTSKSPINEIKLIEKIYPYGLLYKNDEAKEKLASSMIEKFNLLNKNNSEFELLSVEDLANVKKVNFKNGSDEYYVEVLKGECKNEANNNESFIMNKYHSNALVDMFLNHTSGDFVLIGPSGCGKTELINKFANFLDYSTQTMYLFKDMSSRDLIQQRITMANGDTKWLNSPLIEAAINGDLIILDGIHRLKDDTLMSLRRLIQDRELDLLDGRKLLRHDKYDELLNEASAPEEKLQLESKIIRIHPSFRIIATAEATNLTDQKNSIEWLNSEILNLFLYQQIEPLPLDYEHEILNKKFKLNSKHEQLFEIIRQLKQSGQTDSHLKHIGNLFTLRKLIRLSKKIEKYPNINLKDEFLNSCLYKFMPNLNKKIVDDFLEKFNFQPSVDSEKIEFSTIKKASIEKAAKIPEVTFYENKLHSKILNNLFKDYSLGENLLLIGNQGTGKNKLVDKFLMLTQTPREYLQLHRDTTVHSLTVQPSIKNGVIHYEDSPLVKAIKSGEVLVIDEADKAPLHVTSILKSLIESGEMILSDGRRIVKHLNGRDPSKFIEIHRDFKMIILANRPGYPFLGNDFFSVLGDLLSCHPIDNPDPESEIQMLKNYAPNLNEKILKKLVDAFGTLRQMSDQGLISYPYSTREIVNIVKHLDKYPDDSLPQVLANVYDFDHFEEQSNLKETFKEVMNKHGIPVGITKFSLNLAESVQLPNIKFLENLKFNNLGQKKVEKSKISWSSEFEVNVEKFSCDKIESRSEYFSELKSIYSLGAKQKLITDFLTLKNKAYVAGVKPMSVIEVDMDTNECIEVSLEGLFKGAWRSYYPNFKILNLGSEILVHEESTNETLKIDFQNLKAQKLEKSKNFLGQKISKYFQNQNDMNKMINFNENIKIQFKTGSVDFYVIDLLTMEEKRINLGSNLRVNNMAKISEKYLLGSFYDANQVINRDHVRNENLKYFLIDVLNDTVVEIERSLFSNENDTFLNQIEVKNKEAWKLPKGLQELLQDNELNSFIIVPSINNHFTLIPNSSDQNPKSFVCERTNPLRSTNSNLKSQIPLLKSIIDLDKNFILTQVSKETRPNLKKTSENTLGLIELIDLNEQKVKYLQIPKPYNFSAHDSWDFKTSLNESEFLLDSSQDFVYTLDFYGNIHKWEVNRTQLDNSLSEWQKMVQLNNPELQLEYFKQSPNTELRDFNGPKHGKIDADNTPHVGGNTWAGGSGGFDTAGLGGVGGPYRLDSGHQVFQISDDLKKNVPEHVRKAAREMGEKAFRERLKQIQMSPYEHEIYLKYLNNVKRPIQQLRNILESLEAKKKERVWLKNQTQGDLDDAKLVEAITGEKNVYKRRGDDPNAENSLNPEKPKRLKLIVDVSGSMYRFNGVDNRLERELESVLMVMEAFSGFENKIVYDIVGHSGDGFNVKFVEAKNAPKNEAERLKVLHTMLAHSQFCSSGDHTFEATSQGIKDLAKEDADDYFVIVLSDANFDRYGLSPKSYARIMSETDKRVNAFCIFIGTLGNQALYLKNNLPQNKTFICMNTQDIPRIMQQIFQSAMLA